MERWFTSPVADGYRMPAEYEPHHGTIMIWPVRPGSWPHGGRAAQRVFTEIARKIAEGEQLYMLANSSDVAQVRAVFAQDKSIHVLEVPTDDAWARDTMPTFVKNGRTIRGIDWQFNSWGGAYDGLYAHWEQDDGAATAVCEQLGLDLYDQHDFVLEGGSIHSDGEGTVIVTESCLLSPGRNPQLTKKEIEERLKTALGAEKIIWLPRGIYNDETNEHVDNVCAFTGPAEVVLAWTEDTEDPQYALSQASLRTLESETDAKGRPFTVHKLLIPKKPVCVTEQDLEGYSFEEGEDVRECGERLAASYVNFYIANQAVLCPQFGDAHDALAVAKLAELFPGREIYPVQARDILVGGGNIHCITQQIPDFER